MIVLGVDPGGTTGMAVVELDDDRLFSEARVTWTAALGPQEAGEQIEWWMYKRKRIDMVAIERFTIAGRTLGKSRQTDALEIIGVTKFLGWKYDVQVDLQSPADAKNVWTDKRLREEGLWRTNRHVRDALRHALLGHQRRGTVTRTLPPESRSSG